MSKNTKRYLERMNIADARRLAVALEIPIELLLDASFCLTNNRGKRDLESVSDLPQLGDPNVSLPA